MLHSVLQQLREWFKFQTGPVKFGITGLLLSFMVVGSWLSYGVVLGVGMGVGILPTFTPAPTQTATPTVTLTPTLTSTPSPSATPTFTPTPTPAPPRLSAGKFSRIAYESPVGKRLDGRICARDTLYVLAYQMAGDTLWYQVQRVKAGESCPNPIDVGSIAWVIEFGTEKPKEAIDKYAQWVGVALPTPILATPIPVPTRVPPPAPSLGRIGAICRDGTRSSATGRGACSHHGGVARWLYGP